VKRSIQRARDLDNGNFKGGCSGSLSDTSIDKVSVLKSYVWWLVVVLVVGGSNGDDAWVVGKWGACFSVCRTL